MDSLTNGYLAGMQGQDPNEKLAYPGSYYEKGYLLGCRDRESGKVLPKYCGYMSDDSLPIKPGMMVTIVKGTIVKTVGREPKPAGRTYKVKVDHILNGSDMYEYGNSFRQEVIPMRNPLVRWAGPSGYWSEVDLNNIPEAQTT